MKFFEILMTFFGSIAWPATTIFIVYIFREPIYRFIEDVRRIKYGEFEIERMKDLVEEKLNQKIKINNNLSNKPWEEISSMFLQNGALSFNPNLTIAETWELLQDVIISALIINNIDISKIQTIDSLLNIVNNNIKISTNANKNIFRLYNTYKRSLLNEYTLSINTANRYIYLSRSVAEEIYHNYMSIR